VKRIENSLYVVKDKREHGSVNNNMIFEVLIALKISKLVFWVVTPCGFVGRYQRFSPEDGGIIPPKRWYLPYQVLTALQPRKPHCFFFYICTSIHIIKSCNLKNEYILNLSS
jgi:hypothetical protein